MNRIYKVVWSKAKNCYVVASELAKRHTKGSGTRSLSRAAVTLGVVAGLTVGMTGSAWAAVSSATVDSTGSSATGGPVTATSSTTFIQGSATDADSINNTITNAGGFTRDAGVTSTNDTFKVGNTTIGVTGGNPSIDTNTITATTVTVLSDLTVKNAAFTGTVTSTNGIQIGSTDYKIDSAGNGSFYGLKVADDATFAKNVTATGTVTGETLKVDNGNYMDTTGITTSAANIAGDVSIDGKTTMNGGATVAEGLTVSSGGATVAEGLTVSSGGLTVENGDTTVQNLKVNGTLDMNEIQIGTDPTKTNISAGKISASNLSPNPNLTTSGSIINFDENGFTSAQYTDASVSGTASGSNITQQNGTIEERTISDNNGLVQENISTQTGDKTETVITETSGSPATVTDTHTITQTAKTSVTEITDKDGVSNKVESDKDKTVTTITDGTNTTKITTEVAGITTEVDEGNITTTITKGNQITTLTEGNQETTLTKGNQTTTLTEGNQTITLAKGNQEIDITGNQKNTVSGTLTEKITGNVTETYEADQTTTVGGNQKNIVTGKLTEQVTGDVTEIYKGKQTTQVTGNVTEIYQADQTTTVAGAQKNIVTGALTEQVGGKVTEIYKAGQSTTVTGNQDNTVSANQTNKVGGTLTETVTGDVTENYGANLTTTVTTDQTTNVGGNQTNNVTGNIINTATEIQNTADKLTNTIANEYKVNVDGGTTSLTMDKSGTTFVNDVNLEDNLVVKGTSNLQGDVTMDGNASVAKDLTVGGTLETQKLIVHDTFEAQAFAVNGKTYIDKDGLNANNQPIRNLAPGDLSSGSTDAVTGGQLYEVREDLSKDIKKVGAGAAAMANLRPVESGNKFSLALGVGTYRSETAAAIGMFYKPTDRIQFNLSGTVGSGHNMFGGGISFALDKVVKPVGNAAANAEIKSLQAENAEIKAQLEELKAVVESMKTAAK